MNQKFSTLKPMFVGGRWIDNAGDPITSINPSTAAVNFEVSAATEQHVDEAVRAGQQAAAQPSWRSMLPHERARILARIADGMDTQRDKLARLQMMENGKVWSECRAQAAHAAATFRYYAAACETLGAEVTPSRGDYLSMTAYEPYGVVAAITPWNSPLTMESQKVAPALAAGNAVILKPSEITSAVGLALGEIAEQAGLPPGLLSVLPGRGEVTGKALVEHPGVRMISFTGGTANGRRIAAIAAQRLVPAALELGGKSPHIIFDDACINAAVNGVVEGIFQGGGQSCVAGSRLFVQRRVLDRVVDEVVRQTAALRPGLPDSEGTDIGPLASSSHRDFVARMVQLGREDGGTVLTGGRIPAGEHLESGFFYEPTVVAGLSNRARIVQQEIFGPVLCVLPFDDEEDLLAQANDTAFGLAAGVWTANYQRAWRIARSLEVGLVWINTYKQLSIATPFGGFKESGIGREKGLDGVRLYQQAKSLYWGMNPAAMAH